MAAALGSRKDVVELSDVSGPRVTANHFPRIGSQLSNPHWTLSVGTGQETLNQARQICAPLAQWRNLYEKGSKGTGEPLHELSGAHGFRWTATRARHQAWPIAVTLALRKPLEQARLAVMC
jgi:hypothetical protein